MAKKLAFAAGQAPWEVDEPVDKKPVDQEDDDAELQTIEDMDEEESPKSKKPVKLAFAAGEAPWEKHTKKAAPEMSRLETAAKVGSDALAFGLTPAVAGLGAAAGAGIGTLQQGKGFLSNVTDIDKLKEAFGAAKDAFGEGRADQNKVLSDASEANPGTALAAGLGAGLLSGGVAAKGLGLAEPTFRNAMLLGGGYGAAHAASNANNLGEGIEDIGKGMLLGGLTHGAASIATKGGRANLIGSLRNATGIGEGGLVAAMKTSTPEIEAAASRLGTKATPGMLAHDLGTQNVESALENSSTRSGIKALTEKQGIGDKLRSAADMSVKERTTLSNKEVGDNVKQGVTDIIQEKLAPLKQSYNSWEQEAEKIPLNVADTERAAKRLSSSPIGKFDGTPESKIINDFSNNISQATSANDLRTLEKSARAAARATMNVSEKDAYQTVLGTIDRLRNRQVVRAATESGAPKALRDQAVSDVIGGLKETNKGYRALIGTIEDIAGAGKIKKMTPGQFMDALDDIPSEKIGERLFNLNDINKLQDIQKHLPDQFELMRQSRLNGIAEKSMSGGQIDPTKLVNNVKGLGKEARSLLFGKNEQILNDIQTLTQAMPRPVGPSGTPRGISWHAYKNPGQWLAEFADAGKASELKEIAGNLGKAKVALPNTPMAKAGMAAGKGLNKAGGVIGPMGLIGGVQGMINK